MTNFTHLRVHSSYSIKDGSLSPKEIIGLAEKNGQSAVAVTDLNRMLNTINFYESARAKGVKPIIGVDATIERDITDPDLDFSDDESEPTRILLIAKNLTGYRRIMELLSKGYLENQKDEVPYIKQSWLKEGTEGIIALSGDSRSSDVAQELLNTDREEKISKRKALDKINFYKSLFPDGYYLEIQRYDQPNEYEFVRGMVEMSHYGKVELVLLIQFSLKKEKISIFMK